MGCAFRDFFFEVAPWVADIDPVCTGYDEVMEEACFVRVFDWPAQRER